MRILVTGGAGFLGSHLCERLLADSHEVICIDNLITGSIDNIEHIREERFEFIKHDVTNYIYIKGKLDFIFHLASPASPMLYLEYPIQTLKVGSLGTHKALGLAKEKGAGFLLSSTSEVYGDPLEHPQREDYWGNVNPVGPRGVYDESKRFAEALTMAYHRYHKVNTRIARIFNTYGPRMLLSDGRVVPNFMSQTLQNKPLTIFGEGNQTRSFCYVSDLIEGLVRLMHKGYHKPVNLGNPNELTILDFAKEILKISGSNAGMTFCELPIDDPKIRQPDISLAKKILNWEPTILLTEGLTKTFDYFRKKMEGKSP